MKDLVDHIRTVHFTVLAVALILTAALQFERRRPLERAADDAQAISQLAQRWPNTLEHIRADVDLISRSNPNIPRPAGWEFVFPGNGVYRSVAAKRRDALHFRVMHKWIYVNDIGDIEFPKVTDIGGRLLDGMPKRWTNLQEFFAFWDGLHDGHAAFLPLVLAGEGTADCNSATRTTQATVNSYLNFRAERSGVVWSVTPVIDDNDDLPVCEFKGIGLSGVALDLAHALAGVTRQAAKWGTGRSSAEFTELIEQTKHLDKMPLDGLADHLRERANMDTDRIELFQAKLPSSTIAIYGSLVLVTCQFYLLAHLLELRGMVRAFKSREWPIGYVGLYRDNFVFMFTIVSLAAWPAVPLAMSIYETSSEHPSHSMKIAATVLCFLLSVMIGTFSALQLRSVRELKMLQEREHTEAISLGAIAPQPACTPNQDDGAPLTSSTPTDHDATVTQ